MHHGSNRERKKNLFNRLKLNEFRYQLTRQERKIKEKNPPRIIFKEISMINIQIFLFFQYEKKNVKLSIKSSCLH